MSGSINDAAAAEAAREASAAQARAARPDVSVWVSANAGSGKTRVLTNRVARLLLAGADPARILCLTYTKAAAAEMQNRLFKTLGAWTMLEDAPLLGELAGLLAEGEAPPQRSELAAARRLFARALETPGGLRIQTIHAFCEGLLSRFPLEAGVSPHFEVIDEETADALIAEARDDAVRAAMAARDAPLRPALELVMGRLKEARFDELIAAIKAMRAAYEAADPEAASPALAAWLGVEIGASRAERLRSWDARLDRRALERLADAFSRAGGNGSAVAARRLKAALEAETAERRLARLSEAILNKDGTAKTHNFPTKAVVEADPAAEELLRPLQSALVDLGAALAALDRFEASDAAARLGRAILDGYAARKAARAALDYDDLIERAVGLLTRSDARDWVRYKLDGGLEHILVDEAQDTSPRQWAAVTALAEEFFAGQGAERRPEGEGRAPRPRTLFAVGDEKQSIYSFQGAAPELLSAKGAEFEERARACEAAFERTGMATSFRSTPAVLGFVDRVFAPEAARKGLVFGPEGGAVRHRAFRAGAPGMVELWPHLQAAEQEAEPPWDAPVDAPPPDDPQARLARLVAREIVGWIGREPLPARGRTIRAGDVLVLVRKRGALSAGIIKALKALGAPVAGADRLSLTEELAVKDLMALARFCLAPDDDLTVAALLRSPFCAVDEAALFDLAHHRPGRRRLFYELQERRADRPEYGQAYDFLAEMLKRADFARPYELFSHALGPMGGRRRLLARLGPEAQDPIDELMAEALRFERSGGPTLEAFALRLSQREIEIKREHEQGRDEIRVMTAHGAKGLEAPVVVLPDTCSTASGGGAARIKLFDPGPAPEPDAPRPPPVWAGAKEEDPAPLAALREAAAEREAEEHRRLLYVALTRAEDRLLICGASRRKKPPQDSWHALCAAAFSPEGSAEAAARDGEASLSWEGIGVLSRVPTPATAPDGAPLEGWRLTGFGEARATEVSLAPEAASAAVAAGAPAWLWRPAAAEAAPADIRPSDLGGEDPEHGPALSPGAGLGREAASRRGTAIHRLLERLPGLPKARREIAARRLIAEEGLSPEAGAEMIAEAMAVLAAPQLKDLFDHSNLFGPVSRAEIPFAAVLPQLGPGEIHGVIDRLAVWPDRVLIIDYKTGAIPLDPPEGYLRQLAVYRAAVQALYPDRRVAAALLWTARPLLQPVADAALDAALERAAAELDQAELAP